jgi:ankyrin repeat protein
VKYITNNESHSLETELDGLPENIGIDDLKNSDGLTLLHMATFKNQQKAFNQIILSAKTKYEGKRNFKNIIRNWVNAKTNKDSFSALHYSSYRGNTDMAQVLLDLGADI